MRSRSVDWILWLEACDSHDFLKLDTKCGLRRNIGLRMANVLIGFDS